MHVIAWNDEAFGAFQAVAFIPLKLAGGRAPGLSLAPLQLPLEIGMILPRGSLGARVFKVWLLSLLAVFAARTDFAVGASYLDENPDEVYAGVYAGPSTD